MTPRMLRTRTADGGDGHDHDGVDDALDDDRAEDGGPADALALAERMAAEQLAEAGRQDVVGEIADVRVAEDPPVRAGRRWGRAATRQRAPRAATSRSTVTNITAIQAGIAVLQDLAGRREVDRPDEEPDGDDADADAQSAPRRSAPRLMRMPRLSPTGRRAPELGGRRRLEPMEQVAQRRPAGSTGRRRRCAGTRPSWPPRSSASGRRSRRPGRAIPAATTWAISSWSNTKSSLLCSYGIVSRRCRL